MSVEQLSLARYFAFSVVEGFFVGALYCVFTLRRTLAADKDATSVFSEGKFGKILTFIEDLSFFIVFTAVYAVTDYYLNSGKVRLLSLFGIVLGFFVFNKTLRSPFLFVCRKITGLFRSVFVFLFGKVIFPAVKALFFATARVLLRPVFAFCSYYLIKRDARLAYKFGK